MSILFGGESDFLHAHVLQFAFGIGMITLHKNHFYDLL